MKFRETVYLIAISCFCGLVYVFVTSLFESQANRAEQLLGENALKSASNVRNEEFHSVSDSSDADEVRPLKGGLKNIDDSDVVVPPEITIVVVVCGGKDQFIEQAITLIKSAILFLRKSHLKVIGFVDESSKEKFTEKVLDLLVQGQRYLRDKNRLAIEIRSTWFPPENKNEWSQLYAPCSTQRLFFSSMLANTDALIYLDSDTIVLDDLENLWNHFQRMNASQYVGMVAEHEEPGNGWYNMHPKFPYYGSRGLNAGVMLLNLTRMRQVGIQEKFYPILKEYKGRLPWGDQDILNIFFHDRTEAVYRLPCKYNYRLNHCKCDYNDNKSCACRSAEETGVSIFHGNKGILFKSSTSNNNVIPAAFYRAFSKHGLLNTTPKDLLHSLRKELKNISNKAKSFERSCANLETILLMNLIQYSVEYELEDHDDVDYGIAADTDSTNRNEFVDFSLENRLEFME